MKILIDARPLQTYSRYRGIGRYVNRIIELFMDDPDFYFLFFKGEDADNRPANKILMNTFRRGITFTDKITLPRLFKKHRIDVFHSTAFALPPKHRGTRYLITVYDLTPLVFPQFTSKKNLYIFNRIIQSANDSDLVIAISENTKNDLVTMKDFPDEKIRVVYPPFDRKNQQNLKDNEKYPDIPPEYVLYAGGFDGNKNVETLVRSLNIFQKPLVLTGMINNRRKSELSHFLTDRSRKLIFYTGYVSDRELVQLYRNARLFAFPSLYEGFGYPPLEALANGTPSVVSSSGSIKEVLKDGALYLDDPLNEKELAQKIEQLWNDTTLQREIVDKGDIILEGYSLPEFKKKMKEVYTSVFYGSE